MSVTETPTPPAMGVDPECLVCPGCGEMAACAPPSGWPASAGQAPEFSHRDGSVLCPDSRGRVGEPVEAEPVPYALTGAGPASFTPSPEVAR